MSRKKKRNISKGTGKRYASNKPKVHTTTVRRTPPPPKHAENSLRSRIIQFSQSERFMDDFDKAFEQFMGPGAIQKSDNRKILLLDEEEVDFAGFQDWFYFDYVLHSGNRIIDLFAKEVGPQLSTAQRKLLEDWMATNRLRLLETQAVEPGIGETMQDLLSGEIIPMNDISFSYRGFRWSILLARQLLTEGRWHFTGSGMLLTPLEKPQILKLANELWDAYQNEHPQADLLDFYRNHSLDLRYAVMEIQNQRSKPKALFSAEGHPAISARSEFTIQKDPQVVESALDEAEEFEFMNVQEGGKLSGCLHYLWLLRGRSSVPEEQPTSIGEKLSRYWTAGLGEPDFRILGDLYLCPKNLILLCYSRERLKAGKELLSLILGQRITHAQDHFNELKDHRDESDWGNEDGLDEEDREAEQELRTEVELITEQMIERATRRWLDTPDREGVTPRQTAQSLEGREKLRETMKMIEYLADQALKSGKKPPMHLEIIRKELGL